MSIKAKAQGYLQIYKKTLLPEKIWFFTHPFSVRKALKATRKAKDIANDKIEDIDMDGDYSGGQVDAFRHALWMALLTKDIGRRKALKLGKAHERSNRIQFKRKLLEDGLLPDSVSEEMDLYNNERGAAIGEQAKYLSTDEIVILVKQAVLEGRMRKIKKNNEGKFLDKNHKIIPENEYLGKWNNPKVLVPSNYQHENNN